LMDKWPHWHDENKSISLRLTTPGMSAIFGFTTFGLTR
jgi:hypothetical protein